MSDLVVSITTAFRGFNGAVPVNRKSISVESYVIVRWGFAALPVVAAVATLLFLDASVAMTYTSKTAPWKSSALALLFHGLDREARGKFATADGFKKVMQQAKSVEVSFHIDTNGEGVLGLED